LEEPQEIIGLCKTLDYRISAVFNQNVQKLNPTFYIGRGKVEELAEYISERNQLEFAVFDCPLKPNQMFNLENRLGVRVIDRSTLILMIFLHHARTKEAKLQVEYAILNHQLPYVTELIRRTKKGEHPGYMAGGEYKVDEYFRLTKTRVKSIQAELRKMAISRLQRRKNRRKRGFCLVSFAGYTNAGKSSLLKTLTKAKVLVDETMFSTVSPRTRKFRRSNILFTDTVGFIRNIPTQLIEAFKSTLEEIVDADHIMLVVDISEDPELVKDKLITCMNIIAQLVTESYIPPNTNTQNSSEIKKRPEFHVIFNKCDLDKNYQLKLETIKIDLQENLSIHSISSTFPISCETRLGIDNLINELSSLGQVD
jgi:GTP-binding protein HflX